MEIRIGAFARGLFFEWNLGHVVNVYDGEENIDAFSFGDWEVENPTLAEFVDAVKEYVGEHVEDEG